MVRKYINTIVNVALYLERDPKFVKLGIRELLLMSYWEVVKGGCLKSDRKL